MTSRPVLIAAPAVVAAGVHAPADLAGPVADPGPGWFDPVRQLGRRGWKYLTPATRQLLAAAALAAAGPVPPERAGVVAGTSDAIDALHLEFDRIIRTEGAAGLSPAQLPGFSVNIPASQLAIGRRAQAFSVTLTNPGVAGVDAVLFGAAAVRSGRADEVLAAATENGGGSVPRGGAVAVRLTADPAGTVARLLGGATRFLPASTTSAPAAVADRFAALVRSATGPVRLAVSGPGADEVCGPLLVSLGRIGVNGVPIDPVGAAGEYGCVSGLLQLAAVFGEPGIALVVTTSGAGHVAALSVEIVEKATPIVG